MRKIVIRSKKEINRLVTAKRTSNRDHKGGTVPDALKRRMSDLLAGEFSEVGSEIYEKAMAQISESTKEVFDQGVQELSEKIKTKLGELGYNESLKHIRPWLESLITDLRTKGMPDLVNALDGITSEFSVKYQDDKKSAPAQDTAEESEDLLEVAVPTPEPEKVEEVATKEDLAKVLNGEDVAPAAEAPEEKQKAAASFGDVKRRLQTTRKHRRIEAEVPESREAILKSAAAHLKVLES